MNKVRFPKRRPNGSFCVEVALKADSGDPVLLGKRVQEWWSTAWMPANREWRRSWSSDQTQTLSYSDEFDGEPRVWRCTSELRFRFEGKPSAKWWRDWLVSRILPDLKSKFPEVQDFVRITNCESAPPEE